MPTPSSVLRRELARVDRSARRGGRRALRSEARRTVRHLRRRAKAGRGPRGPLARYRPATARRKGRYRPNMTQTGRMLRSIRADYRGLQRKNPQVLIGPSGRRNSFIMGLHMTGTKYMKRREVMTLSRSYIRDMKRRAGRAVKNEVRRGGPIKMNIVIK